MQHSSMTQRDLLDENRELRARLEAAEETLRAIRADEVDALVVKHGDADQVCTLQGADQAYRTFVEVMCQGAATVSADGSVSTAIVILQSCFGLPWTRPSAARFTISS